MPVSYHPVTIQRMVVGGTQIDGVGPQPFTNDSRPITIRVDSYFQVDSMIQGQFHEWISS